MRIAVDVMGGDHGSSMVVAGALMALEAAPEVSELILVGREEEITSALGSGHRHRECRLTVIHCPDYLTMEDAPVASLRSKPNCSVASAMKLVREGRADAVISPGNTGSVVAAAMMRLGRLEEVERPAIAALMPAGPSLRDRFVLVDAGANVDCRPLHLLHFAVMGGVYAREILGCQRPRIGLLNVGSENSKGNRLTREAFKLCQQSGLNFAGNVESQDLVAGRVDVAVCDGFAGNIFLKTCEALGRAVFSVLYQDVSEQLLTTLRKRLDPEYHGGAPLLGVNGHVVIAHGASRERGIANAVRAAASSVSHHLLDLIRKEVRRVHHALDLVNA